MTNQQLLQQILQHPEIVINLTGKQTPQGDEIAWCIFHHDGNGKPPHAPDLRIGIKGYYCHACKAKGSLRDLAQHMGIEHDRTARELTATWDYFTTDGSTKLYQKCRLKTPKGKTYGLRRPAPWNWRDCPERGACQKAKRDCHGGWIWSLKEKPCSAAIAPVLYNLPLLTSLPDASIYVAEGEKCCDALGTLDLVAVCNPYGAGEWRPEYSEALRGREVIILTDADEPGRDHGQAVAESLLGKAAFIRIVDLYPDRSDGSDIADWIAERRASKQDEQTIRAELEALVAQAPEWQLERHADLQTSPPIIGSIVGGEVRRPALPEFNFLTLRQRAQDEGFELCFLSFLNHEDIRLICLGFSTLIAAYPKGGKTSLLFPLARQWATAGHHILYFTEEPEIVWKARVSTASEDGMERMAGVSGLGVDPALLLKRAAEGTEDIVIVDTTNLLGIQDGNDSATVWAAMAPWVEMARAASKTIIFAHHTNKSLSGDLKAVAGSYNFAAIVDCVLLLRPDESPTRRVLGGASRVFALEPVMYELVDGELRYLGDPKDVSLIAVAENCLAILSDAPGERRKTREVLDAFEDPKPSLAQVNQALTHLAKEIEVLRDPPIEEGSQPGKTYRWWLPAAQTSPPTSLLLVRGEVEGSPPSELSVVTTPAGGQ